MKIKFWDYVSEELTMSFILKIQNWRKKQFQGILDVILMGLCLISGDPPCKDTNARLLTRKVFISISFFVDSYKARNSQFTFSENC